MSEEAMTDISIQAQGDGKEGLLFDLPADRPPLLEVARKRAAAAQEQYDAWESANEELPVGIPFAVTTELRNARACVASLEALEIGRMR